MHASATGLRNLARMALATALLALPAASQAEFGSGLTLHHSFPLAGTSLILVVQGADPAGSVMLHLEEPGDAPPSLVEALVGGALDASFPVPGLLTTRWQADEGGLVRLHVLLDDPADVDRPVRLRAQTRDRASAPLGLWVAPPTLLLQAAGGIERVDLRDGTRRLPVIPGDGGLLAAALSATGDTGYLLRAGGLLELRHPGRWDGPAREVRVVNPACVELAGSPARGAAFLIARPQAEPFTPKGRLLFLEAPGDELLLEPMGSPVSGRRWAVTDDGLTAFVAEDDLIVRMVDVLSRSARAALTVGLGGDRDVADLLLMGRRLLVAARRPLGRTGSITIYDMDEGTLHVQPLDVDPLRLVALEDGLVLVVPASGPAFQVVDGGGLPRATVTAPGTWLDAAPVPGGAALLRRAPDGLSRLDRWEPRTGVAALLDAAAPPGTRLVSGPGGLVLVLGDPSGSVWVVDDRDGTAWAVSGVLAEPDAPFAVLP